MTGLVMCDIKKCFNSPLTTGIHYKRIAFIFDSDGLRGVGGETGLGTKRPRSLRRLQLSADWI